MKISIITCTGGRPDAFSLAERWMSKQTRKPDQWIVVDDGLEPTVATMGQWVLRLPPIDGHSLRRNLRAGLPLCTGDVIVFWEDDDFYADWYLAQVEHEKGWNDPLIIGHGNARYYNVRERRTVVYPNWTHASLAMTAIDRSLVDFMIHNKPLADNEVEALIDWRTWDGDFSNPFPRRRRLIQEFDYQPGCVGIKGMPGRQGMAGGHTPEQVAGWLSDKDLSALRAMIGSEAAAVYAHFYDPTPNLVAGPATIGVGAWPVVSVPQSATDGGYGKFVKKTVDGIGEAMSIPSSLIHGETNYANLQTGGTFKIDPSDKGIVEDMSQLGIKVGPSGHFSVGRETVVKKSKVYYAPKPKRKRKKR